MQLDDLALWWATTRAVQPAGAWQIIWSAPSKRTRLVRANYDSVAAAAADAIATEQAVYLSACLFDDETADRLATEPYRRANNADSDHGWATSLWADIDWHTGEDHKAAVLGDRDAADDLVHNLSRVGLAPSVIVSTGGGYHLWWPFNELVRATEASAMCWRLQNVVRHVAAGLGVDYTYDAARIMRCPSSYNHKPSHGTDGHLVTVDHVDPTQYGLTEIGQTLTQLEHRWKLRSQRFIDVDPTANGEVRIPGDPDRGAHILEMMDEHGLIDAKTKILWNNGLTAASWLADQSPSAATMAVMSRVWRATCADVNDTGARQTAAQAALDAGAAWRQRWAPDAKMQRRDWWQRTLARVTAKETDVKPPKVTK